MLLKPEKVHSKFNEENIQITIPKKLLFNLLKPVDRLREILGNEKR